MMTERHREDTLAVGRMRRKRSWPAVVALQLAKLAVGLSIVAFLLKHYDLWQVRTAVADAHLLDLAVAWICAILGLQCYAYMQTITNRPLGMPFTTLSFLKILFEIRFYALFLPGGANALVKWRKLAKPTRQPVQALALMIFGQAFHVFSIVGVTALGVLCDPSFPLPELRWFFLALPPAAALLIPFFVSDRAASWLAHRTAFLRRSTRVPAVLAGWARSLAATNKHFRNLSFLDVCAAAGAAVLGRLFESLQIYLIARSLGIDLPVFTFFWLLTVVAFCGILPVTLSGLGIREASIVGLLVLYGVDEELALSLSLVFYGGFIVGKGAVGAVCEFWDWLHGFRGIRLEPRGGIPAQGSASRPPEAN